tara:strand:- start:335 stop:874 length:540 start_codon:yes stop_codon:yes gene_type:complete
MSIIEETLNKIVREIVDIIIGTNGYTIAAKQNAPRPAGAYASVDAVLIKQLGWEESTLTDRLLDDDIDEHIEGSREVMYSIQFFREDAISNASSVQTGVIRTTIQDKLRAADLGLVSRSDVRDISEALENGWETRAQFDFVLSATGTDDDIITSIMEANISGNFETRGNQLPIDIEVIL